MAKLLTAEGLASADADDTALSAAALRYARKVSGQRLRPSTVERMWALTPPGGDLAEGLAAARERGVAATWLRGLAPTTAEYNDLLRVQDRYRAIAAAGGWTTLPPGPTMKLGDRGTAVAALRERLATEGYAAGEPKDPQVFDAGLQAAVANFQRHHGLAVDGKVAAATRAALNVSADARLSQIEANLERRRWLPRRLPPARIEVDAGGAQIRALKADCEVLSLKAVVGDPKHRTPIFASQIQGVTFNPPWNVPASIAQAEILPKAAKHPGYLAANDFIFIDGRLQQKAGPKSALGQIKFELPSPFGVYLHDTPGKSAFDRPLRDLSHGCVRVERPAELAVLLLEPQGWTPADVEAAIAASKTQTIPLKTAMPLYVLYWTAVVDIAGQVEFRPDVYGWDEKLTEALKAAD